MAGIVVVAEVTGWLGSGLYPHSRLVGETNIHKNIIIIQLGKYSDRDTHGWFLKLPYVLRVKILKF